MPDSPQVLVIDDDRDLVLGLSVRLRASGFDVVSALDGASGLSAAAAIHPRVILLDLRMPGMSGMDVLSALHASPDTAGIPVVVLSGNNVESARAQAMSLGANCVVSKPHKATDLVSIIRSVVSATNGPFTNAARPA